MLSASDVFRRDYAEVVNCQLTCKLINDERSVASTELGTGTSNADTHGHCLLAQIDTIAIILMIARFRSSGMAANSGVRRPLTGTVH